MIPDSEIRFRCPSCQHPLTADVRGAGRPLGCPRCAALIVVPPPDDGPVTQFVFVRPIFPAD
jgi:hypothetical protein